jgi:hypothetical protein
VLTPFDFTSCCASSPIGEIVVEVYVAAAVSVPSLANFPDLQS